LLCAAAAAAPVKVRGALAHNISIGLGGLALGRYRRLNCPLCATDLIVLL
jgi:hypothetical protein